MTVDWHALYDNVKRLGKFGSDAQLAVSLGLTRAQISAWRTGKSDLGTLTKLKLLDAVEHSTLRLAVLNLLPEQNREELEQQHIALITRVRCGIDANDCGTNPLLGRPPQEENPLLASLPVEERIRAQPHPAPVTRSLPPETESLAEQISSFKERNDDKQGKAGTVHARI